MDQSTPHPIKHTHRFSTDGQDRPAINLPWQLSQMSAVKYGLLWLTVIAQISTIFITWELWQVRRSDATFPNLPWVGSPLQIDYGWLLIGTLAGLLIRPGRWIWAVHLVVLAAAISSDQIRCQPQILSPLLLIHALIFPATKTIAVWFLITMWLWAGIHKLFSPDWMGEVTYYMLLNDRFQWGDVRVWDYHRPLAWATAIGEIGLAVVAWKRPKLAAPICFVMHLGIAVFLILIHWNYSVLPWNFSTAIVGSWLLWTVAPSAKAVEIPDSLRGRAVVALLLLTPIGFYFGLVRHSLCHVLYSSNFPDAVITYSQGPILCSSIAQLRVPFPHETKAYLDLFEQTAKPGDTLHIKEYRTYLHDLYFVMTKQLTAKKISRQQFFNLNDGTTNAVACDDRRKLFQLDKLFHQSNRSLQGDDSKTGRLLKRGAGLMVWAIQFPPDAFEKSSLELIEGLPNLEQIQLRDCDVNDHDLKSVSTLIRLKGIGLSGTSVTDAGLIHLKDLPDLQYVDHEQTQITESAVRNLLSR